MTTYRTKDGDVLDWVCWRHYGREDAVVSVLEANRGLAALGPVLPAGIDVLLPDIDTQVESETVRLWD